MRRRELSSRDQAHVKHLIFDICRMLGLDRKEPDYLHIGWEGFLDVYRCQPGSFHGTGSRGWYAAAKVIYEKLAHEKSVLDFARYGQLSLDLPISAEIPVPRVELLQSRSGDFQNSVCFWDYIERLSHDVAFLARRFIEGDSLDEIRQLNHWDAHRTYQAFNELKCAIYQYYQI